MTYDALPKTILNQVASSMVATQRYATQEEALWQLALSAVRSKTAYYRRRIRGLERKYGIDFDTFTTRLKNQATPSQEDDWLAWRSARRMLSDWQKAYQDLQTSWK
jgi:hypothetical protein